MRALYRLMLAVTLLTGLAYPQDRRLWILVPNFENSSVQRMDEFGTKTSTFIFLQLWSKLIQSPTPNPERLSFGKAGVTWDSEALPPRSYEEAEALARLQKEDPILVVWGQIDEWGGSILVHPKLSIRTDGTASSVTTAPWKVVFSGGTAARTISVPLPATRYDFSPVQLSGDTIARLKTPGGLDLLKDPRPNAEKIGEIGDYFTRTEQQGNYAKVRVRGLSSPGWVYVPLLSSVPTEFVDFTSGVLMVLRHDWKDAFAMFKSTASVENAPASVKADALLLAALCLSESGKHESAITLLKGARERPAQSVRLDQYLAMAYLSAIASNPEHSGIYVDDLRTLVRTNTSRQTSSPAWWKDLDSMLARSPQSSLEFLPGPGRRSQPFQQ
jgi:hypothetical protein